MGTKLYNKLPYAIKKLDKMQEFKRRLKHFLMQHTFYSVNEYIYIYIYPHRHHRHSIVVIAYTLLLVFCNFT